MSNEPELPALFHAADATATRGESRHLRAIRVQLVLFISAAALGSFPSESGVEVDWAVFLGGVAFLAAALVRIYEFTTRPDEEWFVGRALAESIKTLVWRYAAGAEPFPASLDERTATSDYVRRASELLNQVGRTVVLEATEKTDEVTGWMRATRKTPLAERMSTYLQNRIKDQSKWYSTRAAKSRLVMNRLNICALILEGASTVGAFLVAIGVIHIDLLGLAGAMAAALTAWSQARQYSTLANSYSIAAHELGGIEALAEAPKNDQEWGAFVAEAEDAISREHTLWRASHK